MFIAITASTPTLDSEIDPRFGRCAYFLIVDPETMEYEAIENQYAGNDSGAGIQTAALLADKGVKVVLTGNCGPKAFQVLDAADIDVITGVQGAVQDAIEQFKQNSLMAAGGPNVEEHNGMKAPLLESGLTSKQKNKTDSGRGRDPQQVVSQPQGRDQGAGRGRGQGGCMGQGRGQGKGMGQGRGSKGMGGGQGRGQGGRRGGR